MNFSALKSQMNMVNQKLTEKVSGIRLTEKGEIYDTLNQRVNAHKKLYEELITKVSDYLQPNPALRAKIATATKLKIKQDIVYPQIESEFAEVFLKYRDQLGFDSKISEALNASADAFVEVASFKYTNEANIRNNFVCHMIDSLEEIKKISNDKKDLEKKRLEFDKLKRASEKIPADPNFDIVAMNTAKANFFQSLERTTTGMARFLDKESLQIESLSAFIQSIIECQKDSLNRFTKLSNDLSTIKETSLKNSGKNIEFLKDNFKNMHGYDPSVPCAIAMYDFEKQNDNELELKQNDMVTLISQVDSNWFKGSKDDIVGFFPCNYVKVLVPLKI